MLELGFELSLPAFKAHILPTEPMWPLCCDQVCCGGKMAAESWKPGVLVLALLLTSYLTLTKSTLHPGCQGSIRTMDSEWAVGGLDDL